MEDEQGRRPRAKRRWGRIIIPILVLLLLASVAASFYLYQQVESIKDNPQAVAQQEVTDLIDKVGQLIILPDGETPTVATVSDPEKLKDQVFFAKAKAGDKVLLYTNAKKAILYDPVANKIIEVAPVNIGDDKAAANTNKPVQTNAQPTPEVAGETAETTPPVTPPAPTP